MRLFWKYQATGNDFILTNTIPNHPDALAKAICDRHFGIGADGLMYAEASELADVKMHYYNSDGSRAKMCGNGLRCFVRFLSDLGQVQGSQLKVETDAGVIEVELDDNQVHLNLPLDDQIFQPQEIAFDLSVQPTISLEDQTVHIVKLGTLHAILFDVDPSMHARLGPLITHHTLFPDGINTNFVRRISSTELEVVTHERGAGWTLSCGTGVAASVYRAHQLHLVDAMVQVRVPGGQLQVSVLIDHIRLSGPARKVAHGQFEEAAV